jgi:hypothetical protein
MARLSPPHITSHWPLALPVGLYLFLAFLYTLAIPPGESPDEPGHLQCIEQVSISRRLPVIEPRPSGVWWSRETIVSGRMCYHMPLYYMIGGLLQRGIQLFTGTSPHFEFPSSTQQLSDVAPAMFIHNRAGPFQAGSEPVSVVVLRLFSIALGVVMLWAVYTVARLLFPGHGYEAAAATLLVAGWPQFLFMSRAITNDVLATTLAVVVLVILLLPGRPYRFVWASLFSGVAILTKINMAFTAVVLVMVLATELVLQREQRAAYLRAGIVSLVLLLGILSPLIFHPVIRLHAMQTSSSFSTISEAAYTWAYWQQVLQMTLSSGWARFGWMNVPAPQWQAYAWWLFIAVAGVVGLRFLWRETAVARRRQLLLILTFWTVGVLASYVQINLNRFQPQFRFVFTWLPVLCVLSGAGFMQIAGASPRGRLLAVLTLATALFLVNLWLLITVVGRAYV